MVVDVWLSMGSNLGNRIAQIEQGLKLLAEAGVEILKISSYYETAPFGPVPQDNFINIVAKARTALPPLALLEAVHRVEAACGRERLVRWGPRTLDIDILLYGSRVMTEPQLQLPHPGIQDRAFVLIPWAEIAPAKIVPGLGTVAALLALLPQVEQEKVWLYRSHE